MFLGPKASRISPIAMPKKQFWGFWMRFQTMLFSWASLRLTLPVKIDRNISGWKKSRRLDFEPTSLDRAINCFTIFLCWAFSQLPFFERLTLRWFRSKWRRKMLCQTHPCANCAFLCLPNMEEIAFICKTQRVN